MSHLQDRPDDWATASQEETIQALFQAPRFINPFWMAFLRRERPGVLAKQLKLHAAGGGHLGQPARRLLAERGL